MLTNRSAHGFLQAGVHLAMLEGVALPQSRTAFFLIGPYEASKASLLLACLVLPFCNGCKTAASTSEPSRAAVRQERQAQQTRMDAARQELEQIPPPSKNRYLSVRTKDAYGNPFLVVHPHTVTLTIIYRDQDPNGFSAGGILRPATARKQEIDVRLDDLSQALSALPPDAWPYGRVVAIEESPTAPKTERVAIRRNVEAAIQILNDLGVVVDEWTGSAGALLR